MNKLLTIAGAVACMVASSFAAPLVILDVAGTDAKDQQPLIDVIGQPWTLGYYDIESISFDMKAGLNEIKITSNYFLNNLPDNVNGTKMGDILIDEGNDGTWDKALVFDINDGSAKSGAITMYTNLTDASILTTDEINFGDAMGWGSGYRHGAFDVSQMHWWNGLDVAVDTDYALATSVVGTWEINGKDNTISIGSLGLSGPSTFGWAMTCGNDYIRAQVPEPGMISIIGMSLLSLAGLAAYRRKK